MGDEGSFRDWQISECIADFDKNSYDFVGRDLKLRNGVSVPFLRYRDQNNLVDVVFYSDEGYESVMDELEEVRELLEDEAFVPRLNITVLDDARKGEEVCLEGSYRFDSSSDMEVVKANMDSIVAYDFDDLEQIYRKS